MIRARGSHRNKIVLVKSLFVAVVLAIFATPASAGEILGTFRVETSGGFKSTIVWEPKASLVGDATYRLRRSKTGTVQLLRIENKKEESAIAAKGVHRDKPASTDTVLARLSQRRGWEITANGKTYYSTELVWHRPSPQKSKSDYRLVRTRTGIFVISKKPSVYTDSLSSVAMAPRGK